jgi:hypothetical protein
MGGVGFSSLFGRHHAGTFMWDGHEVSYQATHFTISGVSVSNGGGVYVAGGTNGLYTDPGVNPPEDYKHVIDAFAAKLEGGTFTPLWELGGIGGSDEARALAVGPGGAYLAGWTDSSDFPAEGGYQGTLAGGKDAFFMTLSHDLLQITYSSFLGGMANDEASAVVIDPDGNAYVTGQTVSANFPTTPGAYQSSNAGDKDAFITKFGFDGQIGYSTYVGGGASDKSWGIAVNDAGGAYVIGETLSADFPTVAAFQGTFGGVSDAFLSELAPDGASLERSTFVGGMSADGARAVALHANWAPVLTGYTASQDFPVFGPLQAIHAGGLDAFVFQDDGPCIYILAEKIHQDVPTNTLFWPAGSLLYGGSIPSTADNLKLEVKVPDGWTVLSTTWTVSGRGSEHYTPPSNTLVWNVGDIRPIPATGPDNLIFTATVDFFAQGVCTVSRSFEIGIRTDDTIVVGWINPEAVPLDPAGVLYAVLQMFPLDGNVPTLQKPQTAAFLLGLSKFYPNPLANVPAMAAIDREYILNWLFKYGGNPIPPPEEFVTSGIIDYQKVADYQARVFGDFSGRRAKSREITA